MGISYYYCIECEKCYMDCNCDFEGHHMIYAYKCDNPTIPFIKFLKLNNLLNDFLKYIEDKDSGFGDQFCMNC